MSGPVMGLAEPCGHVLLDPRTLALITTEARLNRLRWQWRAHAEIYAQVQALALAFAFASESKVAIPPAARDAGFVTSQEYATAAGRTPAAIRLACRQGRIPGAVKRSGVWLIPVAEFAARRIAC